MTIGAWLAMTATLIIAGLAGLRVRARLESRRLDRQFPERR